MSHLLPLLNFFLVLVVLALSATAQTTIFKGTLTLVISSETGSCSGVNIHSTSELTVECIDWL